MRGPARMAGSSARRKRNPCRTATPRCSRKARTLTDQAQADAVQGLQVKLGGGLGRNEQI